MATTTGDHHARSFKRTSHGTIKDFHSSVQGGAATQSDRSVLEACPTRADQMPQNHLPTYITASQSQTYGGMPNQWPFAGVPGVPGPYIQPFDHGCVDETNGPSLAEPPGNFVPSSHPDYQVGAVASSPIDNPSHANRWAPLDPGYSSGGNQGPGTHLLSNIPTLDGGDIESQGGQLESEWNHIPMDYDPMDGHMPHCAGLDISENSEPEVTTPVGFVPGNWVAFQGSQPSGAPCYRIQIPLGTSALDVQVGGLVRFITAEPIFHDYSTPSNAPLGTYNMDGNPNWEQPSP